MLNKAEEIASHLVRSGGRVNTSKMYERSFFAVIFFMEVNHIKEFQINEQIRDSQLRVIDENGQMIGIISAQEALAIAEQKDLDLVKVSPEANPPVCKILDYGKFRYEMGKKEKEAKKNQATSQIKEMRTSVRVQDHDLNVKVKSVQKMLAEGDKVKISVRFRGREMAYIDAGKDLLLKIRQLLGESCVVEKEPKIEGRSYVMYVAPAKK